MTYTLWERLWELVVKHEQAYLVYDCHRSSFRATWRAPTCIDSRIVTLCNKRSTFEQVSKLATTFKKRNNYGRTQSQKTKSLNGKAHETLRMA